MVSIDAEERALSYSAFGEWYERIRSELLDPALGRAIDGLNALFEEQLSDRDRARIRSVSGRVKSKRRTWRKLRQARYAADVTDVDDIASVIDDLVGLRVTCINVRDIDMVQTALENLPRRQPRGRQLWLDPESERDYVLEPKESGYRGWHVNLGLRVGEPPTSVTVELQVRSLLMDGWGELTHEDTYSKDGALPPLVEVLSRRMADLLSTLDDIAEDLRNELDRIDAAAVEGTDDPAGQAETDVAGGVAADAAAMLRDRWETIDRPTELATLAWALQHEFGAEISDDWFGHRSFKRFLRHAVPDGEVSTGRQAFLLPASSAPASTGADSDARDEPTGVPAPGRQLRRVDRSFPLLEADRWPAIYDQLARAWRRLGRREPTNRLVNQLSRSARDSADASGVAISRRHLEHVARTIVTADDTGGPRSAAEVQRRFIELTVQRMTDLRIIDAGDHAEVAAVESWLSGHEGRPR